MKKLSLILLFTSFCTLPIHAEDAKKLSATFTSEELVAAIEKAFEDQDHSQVWALMMILNLRYGLDMVCCADKFSGSAADKLSMRKWSPQEWQEKVGDHLSREKRLALYNRSFVEVQQAFEGGKLPSPKQGTHFLGSDSKNFFSESECYKNRKVVIDVLKKKLAEKNSQ